jgi:hypothetical protein
MVTPEFTYWHCRSCGAVGRFFPDGYQAGGSGLGCSFAIVGSVCSFAGLAVAAWNPQTLGGYLLSVSLTVIGLAFMVGMYVVWWWYEGKEPKGRSVQPRDPDAP